MSNHSTRQLKSNPQPRLHPNMLRIATTLSTETTEEPIQGQLVAKALNEKSQEVGRAVTSIDLGDDDAKNFEFKFDAKLDETLVTKYLVDLKKDS